jgi:hypothetical protein
METSDGTILRKCVWMMGMLTIVVALGLAFGCSASRYRVIVWNETGQTLRASRIYSRTPIATEGKTFDQLFTSGVPTQFDQERRIIIKWPAIQDYNYFWLGIADSNGQTWIINQQFEEYMRSWVDISDGLRIDYFLKPYGKVEKAYWH